MDILVSLDTLVSILGIVIPLLLGIYALARKLDKIERNTEPIKEVKDTLIRVDERTGILMTTLSAVPHKGTFDGTLKNLGKVTVTAEPGSDNTLYTLIFEKPVLKVNMILKKASETGLNVKAKEMFGHHVLISVLTPSYAILTVPSSDATKCADYMSYFLKWLDSVYYEAMLTEIAKYEKLNL